MSSLFQKCVDKNLITTSPKWLSNNIQWEVQTGSIAYGISNENSDIDVYGWCIPKKEDIFPHLAGYIPSFGTQPNPFNQFQIHHVQDKDRNKEYDFTIYSIVKYFHLCMENNPNMVDSLFVPRRCVLHSTPIGEHIRDKRKIFLHKGSWYKFRGYCYSQMAKIESRANSTNEKRRKTIDQYGYDVKFGSHAVRLLLQLEEIMTTGDLHLDRNSAILKTIRNGEWSIDRLKKWVTEKESSLEHLFAKSSLPNYPNEKVIKELLLNCLEMHYGSLSKDITVSQDVNLLVSELDSVLDKFRK